MADTTVKSIRIQLKDKAGNSLYPNILSGSIPAGAVTIDQLDSDLAAKINAIGDITSFDVEVKDKVPEVADAKKGVIYLVKDTTHTGTGDVYDEYILIPADEASSRAAAMEKIGNTDIDLTNYVTKTAADEAYLGKTAQAADSAKVNGLTVETAVPANAEFTDTTYSDATTAAAGLVTLTGSTTTATIGNVANLSYEEITD